MCLNILVLLFLVVSLHGKEKSVPSTAFETAVYSFPDNIGEALTFDFLSRPGFKTYEIRINKEEGSSFDYLVFGRSANDIWISFALVTQVEIKKGKVCFEFEENNEPQVADEKKLLKLWNDIVTQFNKIDYHPKQDTGRAISLYERNGTTIKKVVSSSTYLTVENKELRQCLNELLNILNTKKFKIGGEGQIRR